jgi:hypothetical protein
MAAVIEEEADEDFEDYDEEYWAAPQLLLKSDSQVFKWKDQIRLEWDLVYR